VDRFEIMVSDGPKSEVPIGMYSGGERALISLALLGVLWEIGSQTNLLMIDEPFGLLKEENADRAIDLMNYWGTLKRCVLVSDNTSRVDSIRNRAATFIFEKKNHVSTVKVVA
jgi:DNA repair exonuclease SbcCD ATPase subunit